MKVKSVEVMMQQSMPTAFSHHSQPFGQQVGVLSKCFQSSNVKPKPYVALLHHTKLKPNLLFFFSMDLN